MSRPNLRLVPFQPEHHHPPLDCDCPACAPYRSPPSDRLTANDLGLLAIAGAAVGSAIAFAVDHAGAAHALLAALGLGR